MNQQLGKVTAFCQAQLARLFHFSERSGHLTLFEPVADLSNLVQFTSYGLMSHSK